MKKVFMMTAVLLVSIAGIGASCVKPEHVKTALDVRQYTCIILHDYLEDDNLIIKACDLADDLLPEVRKVKAASLAAKKQAASNGDAGCHD